MCLLSWGENDGDRGRKFENLFNSVLSVIFRDRKVFFFPDLYPVPYFALVLQSRPCHIFRTRWTR